MAQLPLLPHSKLLAMIAGLALAAGALAAMSLPSAAHAQGRRLIYLKNACSRPVRVILLHDDSAPGGAHTLATSQGQKQEGQKQQGQKQQGWYYFNPGEASYLRSPAGNKLTQVEDEPLYAYAETTDSAKKLHWQGDGPEVKQDGGLYRTMPMSVRIDSDGDILTRLTCD